MKLMIYGPGNAREVATFGRLKSECEATDSVWFALQGANAELISQPSVRRVQSVHEAAAMGNELEIDLVLVLSPQPLMSGAVSIMQATGLNVFGVNGRAVALEESKVLCKQFMQKHGVPTPTARVFSSPYEAKKFLACNWKPGEREYVVKSSRFLANAHYRSYVPPTLHEAEQMVDYVLTTLNQAHHTDQVIIEEKVFGPEISLHVLFDGKDYWMFPPVFDYKPLFDNDVGPNTHGMGAIASTQTHSLPLEEIRLRIVEPTLIGLQRSCIEYQYILYIGVMITPTGVVALEYNIRSGNPEWLALLPLLGSPLHQVIRSVQEGKLGSQSPQLLPGIAAVAMAVLPGYPFQELDHMYQISGLDKLDERVKLYCEGVTQINQIPYATRDRAFAISATGHDVGTVREALYENLERVRFNGMFFRTDIGMGRPI